MLSVSVVFISEKQNYASWRFSLNILTKFNEEAAQQCFQEVLFNHG